MMSLRYYFKKLANGMNNCALLGIYRIFKKENKAMQGRRCYSSVSVWLLIF